MNCKTIPTRPRFTFGILGFAWLLSGCARSLVQTTVQPDGSWTRRLTFTTLVSKLQPASDLHTYFGLPHGKLWKTTVVNDDEHSYIAERHFKAGEKSPDILVKIGKSARLTGVATAHRIGPGRWEYREILHSTGDTLLNDKVRQPNGSAAISAQPSQIKACLPVILATDAVAREIAHALDVDMIKAMLGPPRPLLTEFSTQAGLGEQHLMQYLTLDVRQLLTKKFGNRMTAPQREATISKILALVQRNFEAAEAKGATYANGANAGNSKQRTPKLGQQDADAATISDFIPMTFVAQLPGKVLATNGEVNAVTHEVFWGLYPQAAATGDIVLTATFALKP